MRPSINQWYYLPLLLLTLELLMRATGFVLQSPSNRLNRIGREDSERLRILALGESTTADYFSDKRGGAWPRQLERDLRAIGINARVYNEGISGTNTALIASRIRDYVTEYRPQIVVSMMGINDTPTMRFDGSTSSKIALFLSDIRLVKLGRWLWDSVADLRTCKISMDSLDFSKYRDLLNRETSRAIAGIPPSQVEEEIRSQVPNVSNQDLAMILIEVARRSRAQSKIEQAFADRAFNIFPLNRSVAFWELAACRNSGTDGLSRGVMASQKLLSCGRHVPDDILGGMITYVQRSPELKSSSVFQSRGLVVGYSGTSPTRQHYHFIHDVLRENGISQVAMQYPTLPVDQLKKLFDAPESDVVFVSNQENFEQALKTHKYEDLFVDRFEGSWGHTTDLGHQLIAQKALSGVLEVLAQRKDLQAFRQEQAKLDAKF